MRTVKEEVIITRELSDYPILIIGTSGISKEVASILFEINSHYGRKMYDFLGYIGENAETVGDTFGGSPCVCCDGDLDSFISPLEEVGIIIPLGTPEIKKRIHNHLMKYDNVTFPNIISPTAQFMMRDRIEIGDGNIICSGVVMTMDITIGNFNLFNLNSTIGHDVIIGNYCVVNPLCAMAGFTEVGNEVLIGAGSCIKEHTKINSGSTIGMGAIITKEVEESAVMICNAAHRYK